MNVMLVYHCVACGRKTRFCMPLALIEVNPSGGSLNIIIKKKYTGLKYKFYVQLHISWSADFRRAHISFIAFNNLPMLNF